MIGFDLTFKAAEYGQVKLVRKQNFDQFIVAQLKHILGDVEKVEEAFKILHFLWGFKDLYHLSQELIVVLEDLTAYASLFKHIAYSRG